MNIIFIAGWAHDHSSFNVLSKKFKDCNIVLTSVHELIADAGLEFEIDNYSKALEIKLKSFNDKTIAVGWSMGAMVLYEVLLKNPALIDKAVFISPTLKFCSSDDYNYGINPKNVKALKMGLKRSKDLTLQAFFKDCYNPINIPEDLLNERIDKAIIQGDESLKTGLDYLIEKDLRSENNDDQTSSIIIHGEKDSIISIFAGEYLYEHLKNSEFVCLPGGSHDIINSDTEAVYNIIKKFIYNE